MNIAIKEYVAPNQEGILIATRVSSRKQSTREFWDTRTFNMWIYLDYRLLLIILYKFINESTQFKFIACN